jgi:hypothetical protein
LELSRLAFHFHANSCDGYPQGNDICQVPPLAACQPLRLLQNHHRVVRWTIPASQIDRGHGQSMVMGENEEAFSKFAAREASLLRSV